MATLYVRSTDGSDADNGTTWALAKATIAGVSAIDSAGDTIYISQSHAESSGSGQTFAGAGTNASPLKVICGNDAAEPPTAVATTATVTTTSGTISLNGAMYWYGTTFISALVMNLNGGSANSTQLFENCSFQTTTAGSSGYIATGTTANATYKTTLKNCTLKFANSANYFSVFGDTVIEGGSAVSGTTTPTSLFRFAGDRTSSNLVCSGFDFSNFASTINLCSTTSSVSSGKMVFRDCKLPASWSGSLVASGLVGLGQRFEMYNCDSTDTNYRLWVEDYAGSIKQETTIVRTGGASDGTTGLSWKMVTSSTASYPTIRLESPEIHVWNSTLSSVTATIEIVHDTNVTGGQGAGTSSRFQDNEIWMELMYLGTSGVPLGTWVSDCKADILATAADQTDSSETWTTTGLTTPQKQKLSVTFTPAEVGFIVAKVVMAKASKTIYVCPKMTVA